MAREEKHQLALYINHGEHFQLRDIYEQGLNLDWQTNSAGVVVKPGQKFKGFPFALAKRGLAEQGLVVVE